MKKLAVVLFLIAAVANAAPSKQDIARWERRARNVEIIRDDWGIAHVYGRTDADAVFGMIYAQAEDDFGRIERNYLLSIGRLAEAEGEKEIYRDLRQRLFIDPAEMKRLYAQSPQSLKALMDAWADGLNFYLYKHPDVKPLVITRFENWMPLTFSEGSIGGDIETVNLNELAVFYGGGQTRAPVPHREGGSNGIAIAPKNTAGHHALLLINPHTSFYFRSELQMVSNEGLDAYGAVTWGQFFVYQGFNPHCGWMHTSSGVDNIDEYLETVTKKGGRYVYAYGGKERPLTSRTITIPYKSATGIAQRTFTAYFTHHGPVVREANGQWISVRLMNDPMHALEQSYSRTKAASMNAFMKIMELHTNSSNNTVFASSDGDIAYFHSNFIPRRDPKFDWTRPVDGSDLATEWHGVLSISETPNAINPPVGWVYNSNNWPWSAAGPDSPKRADYPPYVERGMEETPRGLHALMLLPNRHDFTIDSLIAAAYDSYMPGFDLLLPPLLKESDPKLADQLELLRNWNRRWDVNSVATSLAIFWADDLVRRVADEAKAAGTTADDYAIAKATREERLASLQAASDRLTREFGSWKTPWGDVNRFQRLNDNIADPTFDDTKPSIPVGFPYARYTGSLASFFAHPYSNTKRWYGTSGNSFVAAVEFGPRIRARAVTAGGESGHPGSPHFNDEAARYATGNLREVYFYREQLQGHTERAYKPGE